ncbi:MAG: hypothetical protein QM756_29340 [Polyangiaceae bacterium]
MSTDADSVPAPSNAPDAPRKKKKKKGAVAKRKPVMRQLSEDEINAPDKQTVIMMGVLSATTIILWIFAHAGCNYHPPRETRRPRNVTTAELSRDPKDAAIEFQQRLVTLNLKGALELAVGAATEPVKQAQAKCDANKTGCAQNKAKLELEVTTSATVLERTPSNAKVRVTSYHLPAGNQANVALVERDATGWKVTAFVPDAAGASLPAPSLPPVQPIRFNVAPGASSGGMQLVPSDRPPGAPATLSGLQPNVVTPPVAPVPAAPAAPAPAAPKP